MIVGTSFDYEVVVIFYDFCYDDVCLRTLSDDGELRMDIRGLVYRPLSRVVDGSLVIDFGED